MDDKTQQKIKYLLAEAAIAQMNGDDDKALKAFQELERFCVEIGETDGAAQARAAQEEFRHQKR